MSLETSQEMNISCRIGEHDISKEDIEKLQEKSQHEIIVKCNNLSCNNNILLVKDEDYDDEYFIIELGKK
jgi:hypothetical protein